MWTILKYRYISCFKNIFSPLFSAKTNFLHLFLEYLLQLQLCLAQILHLLSVKVDSHFYGTSIFRVFKAFSLFIFYMGLYILIWGFSLGISGVFKKISVGTLTKTSFSIHSKMFPQIKSSSGTADAPLFRARGAAILRLHFNFDFVLRVTITLRLITALWLFTALLRPFAVKLYLFKRHKT